MCNLRKCFHFGDELHCVMMLSVHFGCGLDAIREVWLRLVDVAQPIYGALCIHRLVASVVPRLPVLVAYCLFAAKMLT